MPTFTGSYIEPGAVVTIQDSVLPALPPGVFAAAFIGTGSTCKAITNECVTMSLTTVSLYQNYDNCITYAPIVSGSEDVKSSDGTITYSNGTDYSIDDQTGVISWIGVPPTVPFSVLVNYAVAVAYECVPFASGCTYCATANTPLVYLSETVYNSTCTITYTRGDHYTIDYPTGVITWDTVVHGTPPATLRVSYQYKEANEAHTIKLNTGSKYQGTLVNTIGLQYLERDVNGTEIIHGPDSAVYTRDDAGSGATTFTFFPGTGVIRLNTIPSPSTSRVFVVSYVMTKDTTADYQPLVFSSLKDVITWYGTATTTNSLSLAAQIFFENGGGILVGVQVHSDAYAEYTEALTKLENSDVYCIVPLIATNYNTNTGLPALIKSHVTNMSSTIEKKERIAILAGPIGADSKSSTETSVTNYITAIQMAVSARLMYLIPSAGAKTLTSGQVTLFGPYIGAALAGIICNPAFTSGEPISGKDIAGFDSVEDIYTRTQKNKMASYGGLIIEQAGGRMAVRHALSTDNSTIVNQEIKITRIKDYIAKLLRNSLDRIFINTRNLGPVTLSSIKGVVALLLDGVLSLRDIVSYQNLSVTQNAIDPRQIDVAFQIKPTWDVNWIWIQFGVTIQ